MKLCNILLSFSPLWTYPMKRWFVYIYNNPSVITKLSFSPKQYWLTNWCYFTVLVNVLTILIKIFFCSSKSIVPNVRFRHNLYKNLQLKLKQPIHLFSTFVFNNKNTPRRMLFITKLWNTNNFIATCVYVYISYNGYW